MADTDQGAYFLSDFFLGQFLARDGAVLGVIRAVNTAVDAVIGQIERGEKDDTVAVETVLDFLRQRINLLLQARVIAIHQDGSLPVGQALQASRLFQDLQDTLGILTFACRFVQTFKDFVMVDKITRIG